MAHFTASLTKDCKRIHTTVGSRAREISAAVGPVTVTIWRSADDTKDLIQIEMGRTMLYHGEPREGDAALVQALCTMTNSAHDTGLRVRTRDLAEASRGLWS